MSTIIWKARWIIIKDNKIFLAKWIKSWVFYLPGGTHKNWETITECLKREISEELWVKPIIWKMLIFREFKDSKNQTVLDFWFEITNSWDFEKIDKNNCSHWYEWSEAWFYDLDNIKWQYLPNNISDILKSKKDIF